MFCSRIERQILRKGQKRSSIPVSRSNLWLLKKRGKLGKKSVLSEQDEEELVSKAKTRPNQRVDLFAEYHSI